MGNSRVTTEDVPSVLEAVRISESRYHQTPMITVFDTYRTLQLYRSDPEAFTDRDDLRYYEITPRTAYRPDLISQNAYGNSRYWWIILQFNDIDGVDELRPGRTLSIPHLNRTLFSMSSELPDLFA